MPISRHQLEADEPQTSGTSSPEENACSASITHGSLNPVVRGNAPKSRETLHTHMATPNIRRQSQIIPSTMRDFALAYPFVTIAALGASAGAIFASSAILARTALTRLGRKSRISRDVDVASTRIVNAIADLECRLGSQLSSNESSLRQSGDELRRIMLRESAQSLLPHLKAIQDRAPDLPNSVKHRLDALPASPSYWTQLHLDLERLCESFNHLTDTLHSKHVAEHRAVHGPAIAVQNSVANGNTSKQLVRHDTSMKAAGEKSAAQPLLPEPIFDVDQINGAMQALRWKYSSESGSDGLSSSPQDVKSEQTATVSATNQTGIDPHAPQQSAHACKPSTSSGTPVQRQSLAKDTSVLRARPDEPVTELPYFPYAPRARLRGIDDSGSWSFRLLHSRTPYQAGSWSEQSIIIATRQQRDGFKQLGQAGWTTYSHSSYGASATTAKVFVTSSVDMIQLDGFVWRCERDDAAGNFVIVEKLYAAYEP